MTPPLSRRRFLAITAAAGLGAGAGPLRSAQDPALHIGTGEALGAEASIRLYHPDAAAARAAITACFAEVRRLEAIFSLDRADSALSRLNRTGMLATPPPDLVVLLRRALRFGAMSNGAFDVSVQPLWELHARHFAAPDADPAGPDEAARAAVLARVNYRAVALTSRRIALAPGTALTLNGIAQGYITDRVAGLLRARGFAHVLVDMGEMRALGGRGDGRSWQVGIADPLQPWRALRRLPLEDRALATSGGYGTIFEASGRHHHLFDPRNGRSAQFHRSVSVLAPDATTADALSTALAVLPRQEGLALLAGFADVGALFVAADGEIVTAGALAA